MSDALKVKINSKMVDIADLKVTELKSELKKRGVSTSGNKQELYEKLKNVNFNKLFLRVFKIFFFKYLTEQNGEAKTDLENEEEQVKVIQKSPQKSPRKRPSLRNGSASEPKEEESKHEEPIETDAVQETAEIPAESSNQTGDSIESNKAVNQSSEEEINKDIVPPSPEKVHQLKEDTNGAEQEELSVDKSEETKEVSMIEEKNDQQVEEESPSELMEDKIDEKEKKIEDEQPTEPIEEKKADEKPNETNGSQRKRKWLSNEASSFLSSKKPLTISSDTLKSYLQTNPLDNLDKSPIEDLPKEEEPKTNISRTVIIVI